MGVERAVTRWYVQRQLILQKIAALEVAPSHNEVLLTDDTLVKDQQPTQSALAKAQEELRSLGPCPKPMMG